MTEAWASLRLTLELFYLSFFMVLMFVFEVFY